MNSDTLRFSALLSTATLRAFQPSQVSSQFSALPEQRDLPVAAMTDPCDNHSQHFSEIPSHLDLRSFRVGDYAVRFTESPEFTIRNFSQLVVKGWGIEVPLNDLGKDLRGLERVMARQFLRFRRKALTGSLTNVERPLWNHIVDRVDYAGYCEASAVPVPFQGFLKSRTNGRPLIVWVDATENVLDGSVADRLDVINEKEHFVCLVKFMESKVVQILDVEPIDVPDEVDASWIKWVL